MVAPQLRALAKTRGIGVAAMIRPSLNHGEVTLVNLVSTILSFGLLVFKNRLTYD